MTTSRSRVDELRARRRNAIEKRATLLGFAPEVRVEGDGPRRATATTSDEELEHNEWVEDVAMRRLRVGLPLGVDE